MFITKGFLSYTSWRVKSVWMCLKSWTFKKFLAKKLDIDIDVSWLWYIIMTWNLNTVKLRHIKYCQAFLNFALSNLTKFCLCCYIWSWLSGRINSFLRTGMMSDECSRWQNSILPMWSVMLRKFKFRDFKILHKAMPPQFMGK